MTVVRPPVPAPYRPTRPVPARLARLASRHPLVIAAVIVSIVVTLATAVTTAATFAARSWWVFDILTSYRPQYVLVLLVAVVMLAALRCWRTLAVAVLALLLNLVQVAPVYTGHQAAPLTRSPHLVIAHLNLQSRGGDLPAMQKWLAGNPADIVVFLHCTAVTARFLSGGSGAYRMIYPRIVGSNPHLRPIYDPPSPEVVVLTDRSDVQATTPAEAGLPVNSVQIATRLGSQNIELLGVHTLSPGSGERHSVRNGELAAIADWLRAEPKPAIAFGDFNVTYFSPAMQDLLHHARATSSQLGFGVQATWPHQFRPAGIAIDQSVYTGRLTVVARERGPSLGSEHRSLLVTYALAKP